MVYENEEVFAFLDINPNNHGHTLVIPKDHFENIHTLPAETLCRMMLVVQKVAAAAKEAANADGINILMNNEAAAGQVVGHAHIHIIPRHENDFHSFENWPHKPYIENEAADMAEHMKDVLSRLS